MTKPRKESFHLRLYLPDTDVDWTTDSGGKTSGYPYSILGVSEEYRFITTVRISSGVLVTVAGVSCLITSTSRASSVDRVIKGQPLGGLLSFSTPRHQCIQTLCDLPISIF